MSEILFHVRLIAWFVAIVFVCRRYVAPAWAYVAGFCPECLHRVRDGLYSWEKSQKHAKNCSKAWIDGDPQ